MEAEAVYRPFHTLDVMAHSPSILNVLTFGADKRTVSSEFIHILPSVAQAPSVLGPNSQNSRSPQAWFAPSTDTFRDVVRVSHVARGKLCI